MLDESWDVIAEQRDRMAIATFRHKGHYPLVMFVESYIHFGEWVKIVAVHGENIDKYLEVVIENRSAHRATVEFDQLDWKFGRRVEALSRDKGFVDIWTQYPL